MPPTQGSKQVQPQKRIPDRHFHVKNLASFIVASALSAGSMSLTGCASPLGGTTGGGVQDASEARSAIEAGFIPNPNDITVEGFLSEHDIPLPATDGDLAELFPTVAVTWRQPFGSTTSSAESELFFGIGTTIDLDTFERDPQNLAVAIDSSGSMRATASASDRRSKMDAVKDAMLALLDQLTSEDRFTLVVFNQSARLQIHNADPVEDRVVIEALIESITPDGRTDIGVGLDLAFFELTKNASPERANRVILFTDALPTLGDNGSDGFIEQIRAQSSLGTGFTLMGVGRDFGTELGAEISQIPDGNAFFLSDEDRISRVFDDFKFFVTPVAFDVTLSVMVPDQVGISAVYGAPDYIPGQSTATIVIPTLFLSRRAGGGTIIVRLTYATPPAFDTPFQIADATLAYQLAEGGVRSTDFSLELPADLPQDGDPPYYSDHSARRAAILLDTVLVIQDASQQARNGRNQVAAEMLEDFLPWFDQSILGLSDRTEPTSRALSDERDLIETLLGTILNCTFFCFVG